ncbi:MAG: M3 family metallopeptidase, partial [Rikenellaceae bacterium]|nr:M3 family metallopeptidase [Rikenellaceae bacterium]
MRKLSILLILAAAMSVDFSCSRNKYGDNPLLAEWNTPYGIPPFDLIEPHHYEPAIERAMEIHNEQIAKIVSNNSIATFENTIEAMDKAGSLLGRITSVLSLTSSANNTDEIRDVRQRVMPLLSAHGNDIYQNDKLYRRVHTVWENRFTDGLDPMQIRLTEKVHRAFTRSGAHLGDEGKHKLKEIDEKLSVAQLKFNANVIEADRNFRMVVDTADVEGLPAGIREAAAVAAEAFGEKGRYAFTTGKASMIPFLTNSSRADLRQMLYEAYLDRCNYHAQTDNREVLKEIVSLRNEKARILGYDTFADYTLVDRMAASPQDVYGLLDGLWGPALEKAKGELARMTELKEKDAPGEPFLKSDWWYYAEKVRKADYSLDEELLKPYFPLAAVQQGVFFLLNKLYGVTFRPLNKIPLYHKDCAAFEVLNQDNSHLGILITDYIAREGYKNPGAWCGSYRSRHYVDGEKIDPIVTVVCNFPAPTANRPTLLTIDQTETLFHEYGHAIHALFTDVPYRGLQGTERDFVELPSQIMENWALEPQMLKRYALHYSSNNPITDQLIERLQQTATFNQGFMLTEIIAASLIDMDIHTLTDPEGLDVNLFETEMLNERRGLIDQIAPRYRLPYFSHIFSGGYAAGYYRYLWAEVLDKDSFESFAETGDLFTPDLARSFRK